MLLMVQAACVFAQGQVKGKILDKANDEPLGFVNVVINRAGETKMVKGAITDEQGNFNIEGLANGNYDLVVTFVGYKTLKRTFSLTAARPTHHFNALYISEDTHQLKEV